MSAAVYNLMDWVGVETIFLDLHRQGVTLPPCPPSLGEAREVARQLACDHGLTLKENGS